MLSGEFRFYAPGNLNEALQLLHEHEDEAKLLSGGMSLVPVMNLGLARPEVIISLNHIAELAYIRQSGENLAIGATTRHRDLAANPTLRERVPLLAEAAGLIGDVQVRNRGTIGGSLAHADPSADYLPVLVALDAAVTIQGARGMRTVPAREFVRGIMETALAPDELVSEVVVPFLPAGAGSAYVRLARVEGSFAIVNAAAVAVGDTVRAAVGGASPVPVVSEGRGGDLDALIGALEAAVDAISMPSNDPENVYRRAMVAVIARRAIEEAVRRAG